MKDRLRCFFGFHDWRALTLVRSARYAVCICERCGIYRMRRVRPGTAAPKLGTTN